MYIVITQYDDEIENEIATVDLNENRKHTMAITGFYERIIGNNIPIKVGVSYLKTGTEQAIGIAAGVGLSFQIGKMLIIKPMAELNFASKTNNIFGLNLNIGILLGRDETPSRNIPPVLE